MACAVLIFALGAACAEPEAETESQAEPVVQLDLSVFQDSIQAHMDRSELPGGSLLVTQGGEVIGEAVVGYADVESAVPLTERSIFRLASATKIFVSVAFLTLVDEGLVDLSDPVSEHLPEFSNLQVFSPDGTAAPAGNDLTILDLLRHTAGMGYGYEEPYQTALVEAGLLAMGGPFEMDWSHSWTLTEWAGRLARVPLEAEPGTAFSYGLSHDLLGAVVERIAGERLDDFVSARLLDPLGLDDSGFSVPAGRAGALTAFYSVEDGVMVRVEGGSESPFQSPPTAPSGGGGWDQLGNGGMVTSAPDLSRLLNLVLAGGELDGVRVLSRETAGLLLQNHLDGVGEGESYWPGAGFSMGFAYMFDPDRFPDGGNAGKSWWAGSTNTYFWMDPELELAGVFLTHVLPFGQVGMMDAAEALTYEALSSR